MKSPVCCSSAPSPGGRGELRGDYCAGPGDPKCGIGPWNGHRCQLSSLIKILGVCHSLGWAKPSHGLASMGKQQMENTALASWAPFPSQAPPERAAAPARKTFLGLGRRSRARRAIISLAWRKIMIEFVFLSVLFFARISGGFVKG